LRWRADRAQAGGPGEGAPGRRRPRISRARGGASSRRAGGGERGEPTGRRADRARRASRSARTTAPAPGEVRTERSALFLLAARAVRIDVARVGVVRDPDRTARIAELLDEGPARAARERRLVDGRADPVPVGGDRACGNLQVGAQTLVGAVADGAALAA